MISLHKILTSYFVDSNPEKVNYDDISLLEFSILTKADNDNMAYVVRDLDAYSDSDSGEISMTLTRYVEWIKRQLRSEVFCSNFKTYPYFGAGLMRCLIELIFFKRVYTIDLKNKKQKTRKTRRSFSKGSIGSKIE